ncbi:MAG TPA: FUSC family protein, partial [Salinimicrobium sp.]|nr:FUSC family protein [Salinimicrobium sp.]
VVFVYSLLTPDAYKVIEFRLLDTVIGAGLAFLGNSFLWPTWEYRGITTYISSSIRATENYLEEIFQFYLKKGELPVSYKLARKEAFLAIGNLSAAFQRMAQEPQAKEEDPGKIYQIVSLTQELLSSSASLGTFIRTHKTTPALVHFKTRIKEIQEDLFRAVYTMEEKEFSQNETAGDVEEAREYFRQTLQDLDQLQKNDEYSTELHSLSEIQTRFQEARLIDDQLEWLFEISSRLNKVIKKA